MLKGDVNISYSMNLIDRARSTLRKDGIVVLLKKAIGVAFIPRIIYYIGGLVPTRSNLVLFGAHRGESYRGSPRALYEYFLEKESEVDPVWITRNGAVYDELRTDHKPVVHARSMRGLLTFVRAQVGCFTHQVYDLSPVLKNSIPSSMKLVYTTHGRPVKGEHIEKKDSMGNKFRDEHVDIVIATSQFQAEVKRRATMLSEDQFAVTGYPRNDQIFADEGAPDFDNFEDTVLYAPTHRHHPKLKMEFFPFDDLDIRALADYLEEQNTLLLVRPHPDVTGRTHVGDEYDKIQKLFRELTDATDHIRIASADKYPDVNNLLRAADLLVTDYSSIFNDFLLLNRPMVFVPFDYETFKRHKGFLYDYYENIPGPAVDTQEELLEAIHEGLNDDPFYEKRAEQREKIHKYTDDKSTKRVAELIEQMVSD